MITNELGAIHTVIDPKGKRALVDLAPSLSDLEGDDTE